MNKKKNKMKRLPINWKRVGLWILVVSVGVTMVLTSVLPLML